MALLCRCKIMLKNEIHPIDHIKYLYPLPDFVPSPFLNLFLDIDPLLPIYFRLKFGWVNSIKAYIKAVTMDHFFL